MLQLIQIRNYSNGVDRIDPEFNTNDEIQAQGYELIKEFKKAVKKAKQYPDFENCDQGVMSPQETSFGGDAGTSSARSQTRLNRNLTFTKDTSPSNTTKQPRTTNNSKAIQRQYHPIINDDETDSEKFEKTQNLFGLTQWHENSFIMVQIQAYIKHKDQIDIFYTNQVEQIRDLDINDILQKYLQSNINLNSMQSTHRNCEIQK